MIKRDALAVITTGGALMEIMRDRIVVVMHNTLIDYDTVRILLTMTI